MTQRTKIAIVFAVAASCLVAAVLWFRGPGAKRPSAAPPPPAASTPGPLVLQGRSYCSFTTPVTSPFQGEVVEIAVTIGQAVKKDDLLFKLKLTPQEAAALATRLNREASIQGMEGNIQQLTLRKAQLERNLVEARQLVDLGLGARNSLTDLQDQLRVLQSQLELAKLGLTDLRRTVANDLALLSRQLGAPQNVGGRPEYVFVRAQQDGTVISIDAAINTGAIVSGTLGTLGAMEPMIIRGQVHESELSRLQNAANATIALDGGKGETFEAKLSRVSWAALDPSISAPAYYLFELVVPNPENKIKDGFKVQVTLSPPQ
jgi:multidrug resistance efflux pump